MSYTVDAEDAWKFTAHRTGTTDGSVIVSITWPPPELAHVGHLSLDDVHVVLELSVVKLVDHETRAGNVSATPKKRASIRKKKKKKGGNSSDDSGDDRLTDLVVAGPAGSEFIELSCGYAQICVKDFILSPRSGTRRVKVELRGGTPFAPTAMDCGRSFQRRAGWQKFKMDVNGVNKSECELEVTTLLGPAVVNMGPTELALQQEIDDCLGYGRQQGTTLGALFGQQFDASVLLPVSAIPMLTYFRRLIAKSYGTDAVADGEQSAMKKADPAPQNAKKATDSSDSSDSSSSDGDSDEDAAEIVPKSQSDPRLIRAMFTRLMDNPGILRRAMIKAWAVWRKRKAKKVDKIGADAFSELDRDGGGTVDAEEFKKFFEGETEEHRLERVFDDMVVKVHPLLSDEAMLYQAVLTAPDNATALKDLQRETSLLYETLISEEVMGKEFKAFGGSALMVREGDGDDGAREEIPFSLADVKPFTV